jgi:hypothetical protein
MTYEENIKRLDREGLGAMKTFLAQTFFIIQRFVQENRDNTPLEDWEYDKIIRMIKSGDLK